MRRSNHRSHGDIIKSECKKLDESNPILQEFRKYRKELDDKHDRHERIVKLARDITIESKRIIFHLHTIDCRQENKAKILDEAKQRLKKLIDRNFKAIAEELEDLDPYQYRWAYSPGLQEFVEAYTFVEYMSAEEALSDWNTLQQMMIFSYNYDSSNDGEVLQKRLIFFVDPTEYILGLSDLTGELMRRCINCLGSGETQACMDTCKTLQKLYTGYISLRVYRCREMSRKIYTMQQNVLKAENVCYNVKVRGGEAAKWGTENYENRQYDEDEGYCK